MTENTHVRDCDCKEWDLGWPQIEGAQMLAWNHGSPYTGPIFNFCPWCRKKLRRVKTMEE